MSLEFAPQVPAETQLGIRREFDQFIANSRSSTVRFTNAPDSASANMKIRVKDYTGVSKRAQVWGVASCVLGVISAGIGFGFISIPVTSTTAQLYVYDGDNNTHIRRKTQIVTGPGFLKRQNKQIQKHPKRYRKYFRKVSRWYEKDLVTATGKATSIN